MKRLSVPPLAVVCLAVAAGVTDHAGASDRAQPTPYYDNAAGGYETVDSSTSTAGSSSGTVVYGSGAANDLSGYAGPTMASYPQSGFAGYNYPIAGFGYAGYGYGGYIGSGIGGYGGCAGGYGGCKVKVHNRLPPRGYKNGPLCGGSCSYVYGYPSTGGHIHRCHLWRTRLLPCSTGGGGIYGPVFMDPTPAQPQTGLPTLPGMSGRAAEESLQPPAPSLDNTPTSSGDGSST
jgi:hypothetical protein